MGETITDIYPQLGGKKGVHSAHKPQRSDGGRRETSLRNMTLTIGYTGGESLRLSDRSSDCQGESRGLCSELPTNPHRKEAFKTRRGLSPMGNLRLEPRAPSHTRRVASQWYSGHVALSGVQRVYPGWYREA